MMKQQVLQIIVSLHILLSSDLAAIAGTPGSCGYQSVAGFDSEDGVNCTSLSPDQCVSNDDICVIYQSMEEIIDIDDAIDIQSSYYYSNFRVGGGGGTTFNLDRSWAGVVIQKFEVWQGGWQLHGIRVTYSDGTRAETGSHRGSRVEFELNIEGGEFVNYLSVYGNGAGSRTGAFHIKTNKGRSFFPQMTDWGLKTEYKMESGGGLILGIRGQAGSDIDNVGFTMIRKIDSMQLRNVQYVLSDMEEARKETVHDITIPNGGHTDSDSGSVQKEVSVSRSHEFSVSASYTYKIQYSVSGGIPELIQGGHGMEWSISLSATYASKWEKTETDTITIPLIAPKRTKTQIIYYYYTGTADVTWSGRMFVKVDNGAEWNYAVRGTYIGVDATRVVGDSVTVAKCDPSFQDVCYWMDEEIPLVEQIVPMQLFGPQYD